MDVAQPDRRKVLNPDAVGCYGGISSDRPVLVVLAAGKGTRFGPAPKCAQMVGGIPLARHAIEAFHRFSPAPVICVVGYCHLAVAEALGNDNIYVLSGNSVGGTAYAAFEVFSLEQLTEINPLLIITMGDRIVTERVFGKLYRAHSGGRREADLTLLTAVHTPPGNRGKGRVLRDAGGMALRIVEQRDIDALPHEDERDRMNRIAECNCPLYAIRAATLYRTLAALSNANAQHQYYLTDIVERLNEGGCDIRTITVTPTDPDHALLCTDVTRAEDLAELESVLARMADGSRGRSPCRDESKSTGRFRACPAPVEPAADSAIDRAARAIAEHRPETQTASIARQIIEMLAVANAEQLGFKPDQPVAIGISGGRFRIAFMHPDMGRFFGPAWQMPIGAGTPEGEEQIVILAQRSEDQMIHLFPTNPKHRHNAGRISACLPEMYPAPSVVDWHSYEEHGTRMTDSILVKLGYVSDAELKRMRERGEPLPPQSRWVSNNMRHPFPLVCNALVSIRTIRTGSLAGTVEQQLGRGNFPGLRIVCAGNIPEGGFSSSSAVTVATQNALNALFGLDIPPDLLVSLACQAEYGTGVRAGSLDQATEQKGQSRIGTLISSNPRDSFRVLGTHRVPADRFKIIFPYTVERDRDTWLWSWGAYGETPCSARLTAGEIRKLTGKAAEIAAILLRLPFETDLFKQIEQDLLHDGALSSQSRAWVTDALRRLPVMVARDDLHRGVLDSRDWYIGELARAECLDRDTATLRADGRLSALFAGWRNPVLRRATENGIVVEESGVPLRTMVAYLFAEVARNFRLIHDPDRWIDWITWSQRGDRSVEIDPERLPARDRMEQPHDWERGISGPQLLDLWLERFGATPFDYQSDLSDECLNPKAPPEIHLIRGATFFRGLALIDLAEAMLKRAFGPDAVAVRVNGAGQGDYFQVHVDTTKAGVEEVKNFIRTAFYRRFGLSPNPEFVEVHPGGGAVGICMSRYDQLPKLVERLRHLAGVHS